MPEDFRTITNSGASPLTLWLEPWAAEYSVQPGQSISIAGRSERPGRFELVEDGDESAVYGWPGASVTVRLGNDVLDEYPPYSEEGLPDGMSIRSFIETMFDGPGGPKTTAPTHIRFRVSIIGCVALLATIIGMAMFVASLFLPATRGGESGLFMLILGLGGSFGMVPSDQPELQAYSLVGSALNLTLWVALASWFFSSKKARARFRGYCGIILVAGFLVLTLFPAPNSDGTIGYRTWAISFLLVGVGLLLSSFDKRLEKMPFEG